MAVCVTSNPGPYLEECLESLVSQDYPNLSILVIDAGSEEQVVDRVAAVAPDAFIHRIQNDPGFSAAANQALTLVSDASFKMFCHDDVALDAHCVSALVEELFRSNAGIVTPKVVEWDDQRRLRQVGMGSDRFGVQVDLVERGEFDQEQYDGVRDVFVAPSGVQLVRADLFKTLGGFDPALGSLNEDLDFCWRAHAVGARVVVVPSTFVRHRDEHTALSPQEQTRILTRNRLRTMLVTSSRVSLLLTLPLAILIMLIEAVYLTLAGRRGQASALVGALTWNMARLSEIRQRRAALREIRQVSDAEIRALQVGGSARLNGFFRGQFGAGQDRVSGFVGSVRANLTGDDSASAQAGLAVGGFLLLVGLFGSRHLITRGIAVVGQIPGLPGSGTLFREWWGGWRSIGMGGSGAAPVTFAVYGAAKTVFFWGSGILDLLLVVGPLAIGAIGIWRLVGRLGSTRASAFATLAYVANPLPVAAMTAARWDALVVWGAAPFLVGSALNVQGSSSAASSLRILPIRLLRYGLLVALIVAFAPSAIVVAVLVPAALVAAAIITIKARGVPSLAMAALAAVIVPIGLLMPWSFGVLRRFSWEWLVGPPSPEQGFDSLADLMRFATGSASPSPLAVGILVAAAIGLMVGRGQRFEAAARGWTLATVAWLLVWAGRRGWLQFDLPAAEALLPVAATGLALAVGATIRALEIDFAHRKRAWRSLNIGVAALALVAVSILGLRSSFDGRWGLPSQSYVSFTTVLAEQIEGPSRVLWLGDPAVMPVDTQQSGGGVNYAVTEGGTPDVVGRYAPGNYGLNDEIGARLDLVVQGQTSNLGRLLAPYGIDLVIVVPRLAPAPYDGPALDPGGGIAPVLDQQLDLQRVAGTPNLFVYRNGESRGPAVSLDDVDSVLGVTPAEQLDTDLTGGTRAQFELDRPSHWHGGDDAAQQVMLAVPADGWESGNTSTELLVSNANTVVMERAGEGPLDVSYHTSVLTRLVRVAQLALLAAAALLAQTRREGTS